MLDPAALKDIRPFVATPSYSGAMTSLYVRSLLGLVNAAWTHGFACLLYTSPSPRDS